MTTERVELMPGVWLTTVRTKKFKSSYWALRLLTPLKQETAAMNAMLPFVLRRGTARLPDLTAFSAQLDELYGGVVEPVVGKSGDVQAIGFEATFLDDAFVPSGECILEQVAQLLGDLLLRPATKNGRLRGDYVSGEKDNLIRQILAGRNDKRQYALERLVEEMYAGTDYAVGRFGAPEQVKKINVAKLFSQYQTLLEKAPIELFYCGSASAVRVEMAWREALMDLPRGFERYELESNAGHLSQSGVREFRETLDVVQGKMQMGFQVGFGPSDPMYPAMLVANAMFGGTPNSRLFLHVREKRSLCYYANSTYFALKGLISVACGVEPEKFDEARDEIMRQLSELRQGEFTRQEFEAAQRSVVNSLRTAMDEQGRMCARWLMDRAGGEHLDLPSLIKQVEDVTAGQAAAAAMELRLDSVYYLAGPEKGGDEV